MTPLAGGACAVATPGMVLVPARDRPTGGDRMGKGEAWTAGAAAADAAGSGAAPRSGSAVTEGVAVTDGVAPTDGVIIPGPTGQQMIVKVSGAASRGAYSLIEYSHRPGAPGPPPHVHRQHEEAFFVLEGELTLAVGPDVVTVGAGQTAVVPRGQVHQPSNRSDRPVRFVFLSSPPMDEFFAELARLVTRTGGSRQPAISLNWGSATTAFSPACPRTGRSAWGPRERGGPAAGHPDPA